MEKHPKQLHVRVSAEELDRARALAETLGMTLSDLVRALVQLPAEGVSGGSGRRAIVVDTASAARIAREMRRWGYQYNQAVHALNRLAYFMERGRADRIDAAEELAAVSEKLGVLDSRIQALAADVSELVSHDVVYR